MYCPCDDDALALITTVTVCQRQIVKHTSDMLEDPQIFI